MPRTWADQVVTVERVEEALDHRPDGDRQDIDKGWRSHRSQKDLAPAGVGPTGRKGRVVVGRSVSAGSNVHVALVFAHMAFRRFPTEGPPPPPGGKRGPKGRDEGSARNLIVRTWHALNGVQAPTAKTLIR